MTRAALALLAAVCAWGPCTAAGEQAKVTPVQKVIQLLEGMVAKGKKEKHAEQVQYAAFKQFCDDTTVQKQNAIKEANEMIEVLNADIENYEADAAQMAKFITKHDETISTAEGDLKAATKIRELENEDFIATASDYGSSITAIEEAIETMKKEAHDAKQAGVELAQVLKVPIIPAESRRVLEAFIAQDPDEAFVQSAAPEAAAYQSQAGGIIDMLVKLGGKFQDELSSLEREETEARQTYEMLALQLKNKIDHETRARTEKTENRAKALQLSADANGDRQDTTTTRDGDSKYLSDLTATCEQKSAAFAERQQLRADEIAAIEKAVEILSSGSVAGMSEKHLPQLIEKSQLKTRSSFAQLRSDGPKTVQLRVAAYLKTRGSSINSQLLSALALRVSEDPFKKVKKMVRDLIVKLEEEANDEATQKGFCDTELASNEATRKEKTEGVETLTAEIDFLESSITKLAEEISDLTNSVAALDAATAKATTIRADEKEKNVASIRDAQEAQTAVAQALAVLKDFYEKASDATSFVQEPEIFDDEPYKGMQTENGGVMGMIEVIQSDFARLESETTAAEEQGQKEYDDFMGDSTIDKGEKTAAITHKTSKKQNDEKMLQEKRTDVDGMQKELDASNAYYEKLKPSCLDASESYEERVARRKEEIESLQEAVRILSGEDIA